MKKNAGKTVPIDWIGDTEKYILVPRKQKSRVVKKVKRLIKVKGGCYFTQGVPHRLIDFVYRAVIRLGLRDRRLIFSRGAVRVRNLPTSNVVEVLELDWDLGTSFIIPLKRTYRSKVRFAVGETAHTLHVIEVMVLSALLRLVHPDKSEKWRSSKAVAILARGWGELRAGDPPAVNRVEDE